MKIHLKEKKVIIHRQNKCIKITCNITCESQMTNIEVSNSIQGMTYKHRFKCHNTTSNKAVRFGSVVNGWDWAVRSLKVKVMLWHLLTKKRCQDIAVLLVLTRRCSFTCVYLNTGLSGLLFYMKGPQNINYQQITLSQNYISQLLLVRNIIQIPNKIFFII